MDARLRFVLGIALTVVTVGALWMFVVAPRRERADALGAQVAQSRQRLNDASARAAVAEQARATYARDYATVARLGKAVPVSADVPSLVFQLESAARHAHVDFRAVTATDPTPNPTAPGDATAVAGGGVQPAPFSFKFRGSYFDLQRLLAEVDRFARVKGTAVAVSGRLLTIDGLTISPTAQGRSRIQGMVTARAYVAEMPDQLPTSTTAATTVPTGSSPSAAVTAVTP
jgi:Tfp pilus assembly protein PilO